MFSRFLRSASLSLLAVAGGVFSAQARTVANVEAACVLGLKLTFSVPGKSGSVKNGGYYSSAGFQAITLTSRDVLDELIYDGQIAGPLAGWKLVARCTSEDAFALGYRLFAVKTGQPDYALDSIEVDSLALEPAFAISSFKETYFSTEHFTGSGTVRYNSLGKLVLNDHQLFVGGNTSIPYSYKVFEIANTNMSFGLPGTSSTRLEGGMVFSEPGYEEMNMLIEGTLKFSGHKIVSFGLAE